MTTTAKRTAKKNLSKKPAVLPPSADVVKISGREYLIAPLDEYREWEEDRALAALMAERLDGDGPYVSLDEFEKMLARKNKRRKK